MIKHKCYDCKCYPTTMTNSNFRNRTKFEISLIFSNSLVVLSLLLLVILAFVMLTVKQMVQCHLEDVSIQRDLWRRSQERDAAWRNANGVPDLPIQLDTLVDAIMAPTRLSLWLTDDILDMVDGNSGLAGGIWSSIQDFPGLVERCEKQREDEVMEVLEASASVLLEMEKEWQKESGRYDEDGYFVSEETDAYIEWQKFLFEQCNPSELDAQDVERNGFAGSRLEFTRFNGYFEPGQHWCCGAAGESLDWRLANVCDLVEMSEDMDLFDLEVDMLHYLIGNCVEDGPVSVSGMGFDYDHKMNHCGHGIQPILQNVPLKVCNVGPKYSTVEWEYGKAYCSNYATPCVAGPFLGMEFVGDLRFNPGNVSDWAVAVDTDGQNYDSVAYGNTHTIMPHP